MKVLVCGSRDWPDTEAVKARVHALPDDAFIIEGAARGADTAAREAAEERGLFYADVPVKDRHWKRHGRSAGHKRNIAMLDLNPDLVIAFQSNGSSGTQGTIDHARKRGIPVEVYVDQATANALAEQQTLDIAETSWTASPFGAVEADYDKP